jgi:serine/threonine protein kinase
MRFIRGESLKEAIARYHTATADGSRSPELEFRSLLTRFIAACNTVAYAHSRGIIHRDVKPANLMLGPYGETLVVDWGLAKTIGRGPEGANADGQGEPTLLPRLAEGSAETQAGAALGTPAYMSPEQALGRLDQLGPASDVYSLGATCTAS